MTTADQVWDCVIVGGGAAGLSAGLTLGRARRSTLVIDEGQPSNQVAAGVGGLLGHDGRSPAELYQFGRDEIAAYPTVELVAAKVVSGSRQGSTYELVCDDGSEQRARAVLLAMGMDYRFPDVVGISERWGRSVFHCPFCHAWELRGRPLGVLDVSPRGAQRALLLRMWSESVTLFTDGPAELKGEDIARLQSAGIAIDQRIVTELRGPGDALEALVFSDGTERQCEGLLVDAPMRQRTSLAIELGASLADTGSINELLVTDAFGRTDVEGLYAAGDVSTSMPPSVATSIAEGATTAKIIVHDLLLDMFPIGTDEATSSRGAA